MAAVMSIAALAGCGSGSSTSEQNQESTGENAQTLEDTVQTNETSEEAPASELDLDDIYDLYVTWPSLSGAPADIQLIEQAVNEIVEPKLGINVVLNSIPLSDLISQQQLLISSGDSIDVVVSLWTGIDTWVNSDSLLELEDLLPVYAADYQKMNPAIADGIQFAGHTYALPAASHGYPYGFMANSDILAKYGFDTADRAVTIDEIEEIMAAVKEGEGDGFYPVAGVPSFGTIGAKYDQLGAGNYSGVILIDENSDTVVNLYESDVFKEYADRMYDWAQKGYIAPDAATSEDTAQTLLATGSYLGAFTMLAEGVKASYGSNGLVPLTNLTLVEGYTKTSDTTDSFYGVAATCEQPEKAVAFLNELYSNQDLMNILQFGIEGTHYVVSETNEEGFTLIDFPEGVDMGSSGYYVFLNVWNAGSNSTAAWNSDTGFLLLEENAALKELPQSPAYGYVFDSTEYATQVTALSAIYNEYDKIISCGAIDPEKELTAFVEALKAAGIDDIIAANQEQYDAFRAAK